MELLVVANRPSANAADRRLHILCVDRGDDVKTGDLLATVASVETDEQYEGAVRDLQNKKRNWDRARDLVGHGWTSQQAADQAEKQGLVSVVATYRAASIRAALDSGDVATADADWAKISALEEKYIADPGQRRDAKRLLMAHARLNLAKHDLTDAADEVARAAGVDSTIKQADDTEWEQILVLRAEVELAQHAYGAADKDAQVAVTRARLEAVDPNSSAWIGEALILRARCEAAMGNRAAAAASAREALPHLRQNLDPSNPLLAEEKTLEVT